MTSQLEHRVRSVADPQGLIVLFHGRGADELDLYPLFDVFDPDSRFMGVSPRGPLDLPPGGAHWYVVRRVGYPDPATFGPTFATASEWLDAFVASNGFSYTQVVLGGFSQGAVMSYALGLGRGRPAPAGIAAFSGFVPQVEGFEVDPEREVKVIIGHGTYDPVISVEFGHTARDRLTEAGLDVTYREYPLPHAIDPSFAAEVGTWITDLLAAPDPRPR